MKRRSQLVMAVQTALGLALNVARGGEVLDQSFIGEGGSVSGVDDMAQTFTVGRPGTLSGVEVELFGEAAVVLGDLLGAGVVSFLVSHLPLLRAS